LLKGLPQLTLIIRNCTLQDIHQVLAIENASFDDPYPESLFVAFLRRFPAGFRVAESAGTLAGYSAILPMKDTHTMVITSLAVHPNFKREKIATRLLEDAVSISARNGATLLELQVAADNLPARELYRKFNFVQTGIMNDYYGKGKDGIEMELQLDDATSFTNKRVRKGNLRKLRS
jgi:[ribosomal protein S18]-alanine N-acetyltransferase